MIHWRARRVRKNGRPGRARPGPRGLAAAALAVCLSPSPALAIQTHGGMEGLYSHQIGHLLFLVAVLVLAARLRGDPGATSRGWRYVKASCLLFAAWNAVAFCGHWLEEGLPGPAFVGGTGVFSRVLAEMPAWKAIVYYLCKLDHLLAVPAMLFFLLGLRAFRREET